MGGMVSEVWDFAKKQGAAFVVLLLVLYGLWSAIPAHDERLHATVQEITAANERQIDKLTAAWERQTDKFIANSERERELHRDVIAHLTGRRPTGAVGTQPPE